VDHFEYLPPEKLMRSQIEELVRQILVFPQQKRSQQLTAWNEVKKNALDRKSSIGSQIDKAKSSMVIKQEKGSLKTGHNSAGKQNTISSPSRERFSPMRRQKSQESEGFQKNSVGRLS